MYFLVVAWFLPVFVCSCTLCQKQGHLPITMSLSKAYELNVSVTGRRSIRKLRKATYTVEFMVCEQVQPVHLVRAATAARLEATAAADADHAIERRRAVALQPGVVDLTSAGRADAMDRALDAHSGPNARAAVARNPQGEVFHREYARGLRAELDPREARLYAGAMQAGERFGSSSVGRVPNSAELAGAIHKALSSRSRQKRNEQAANIANRLGQLSGPAGAPRV